MIRRPSIFERSVKIDRENIPIKMYNEISNQEFLVFGDDNVFLYVSNYGFRTNYVSRWFGYRVLDLTSIRIFSNYVTFSCINFRYTICKKSGEYDILMLNTNAAEYLGKLYYWNYRSMYVTNDLKTVRTGRHGLKEHNDPMIFLTRYFRSINKEFIMKYIDTGYLMFREDLFPKKYRQKDCSISR